MPHDYNYEKALEAMSDSDLFKEMDSVSMVINGFPPAKVVAGMASRAQLRYNTVATEVLKRQLWVEYNSLEDNTCD